MVHPSSFVCTVQPAIRHDAGSAELADRQSTYVLLSRFSYDRVFDALSH
jgi:hypothetical protein